MTKKLAATFIFAWLFGTAIGFWNVYASHLSDYLAVKNDGFVVDRISIDLERARLEMEYAVRHKAGLKALKLQYANQFNEYKQAHGKYVEWTITAYKDRAEYWESMAMAMSPLGTWEGK